MNIHKGINHIYAIYEFYKCKSKTPNWIRLMTSGTLLVGYPWQLELYVTLSEQSIKSCLEAGGALMSTCLLHGRQFFFAACLTSHQLLVIFFLVNFISFRLDESVVLEP